jgi:hypothetical protein
MNPYPTVPRFRIGWGISRRVFVSQLPPQLPADRHFSEVERRGRGSKNHPGSRDRCCASTDLNSVSPGFRVLMCQIFERAMCAFLVADLAVCLRGCHRNCHRTGEYRPKLAGKRQGEGPAKTQQNRAKRYQPGPGDTGEWGFQVRCLKPAWHL